MTESKGVDSHVRVNIRVSPEVHQYYKQRAEQSGASMSVLMFLALEKAVREERFMGEGLQDLLKVARSQGMLEGLTDGEKELGQMVLDMDEK